MSQSPHHDRLAVLLAAGLQRELPLAPTRPTSVTAVQSGPPPALTAIVSASTQDALGNALLLGRHWDVRKACAEYVAANAYLIDLDHLAVGAIARVMMLAGGAQPRVSERLPGVIQAAAAPLIRAGPEALHGPTEDDLCSRLAKRLGIREPAIPAVQAAANGYPLGDRRILYGCLAAGLTPKACARAWGETEATVRSMLAALTRYGLDVQQALSKEASTTQDRTP